MSQTQSFITYMKQTWISIGQALGVFKKAFAMQWQASRKYTLAAGMLFVLQGTMPVLHIWLVKVLIDRVTLVLQQPGAYATRYWLTPLLLIVAVKLATMWAESVWNYVNTTLEHLTVLHVQHLIFKKTAELDIAFFENPTFYDQLVLARNEIWRFHNVPFLTLSILQFSLSLLLTLGMILSYQPLALLVLVITSVPYAIIRAYLVSKQAELEVSQIPSQRMVNYIGHRLVGVREVVKEIRIFGLENLLLKRFVQSSKERIKEQRELMSRFVILGSLVSTLPTMGIAVMWSQAVLGTLAGEFTLGTLTLLIQTANQAQTGLQEVSRFGGFLVMHTLYLTKLFDYLNLTADDVEGSLKRAEHPLPVPEKITQGISFEDVSFRYPGSDADVLNHLTFTLKPGETIALVGENGAGKTTLVKLLARQFDPTDGQVLLDGRDLADYDLDAYLRQIGVIFQDFVQYHLPVRDNIGFGDIQAMQDNMRLFEAAGKGGARALIDDLPNGLDTMLGKTFEGGTDLSGGQWQKLALSRAFMRDGQILILDEPTASLDALAEMEIYQRFADLIEGKIGVIVSHRFSTVKMADHILVLKDGRLIEEGNHQQLMELGGHYAEMYTAQAQNYT